ncbi:hypothetical protein [Aureimonas glaciei]|uniref:Uncharacterized protein n=1 Tax=Aureimonas glaciei TaxID=1776957 RepID=A0A916YES8_9HYPH|nr:hypothetical protein [Aureimonas glaciei]GGD41797.1 hypothetical protein GCM10011335_50600 [Aureimonas glaciei]
MPDREAPRSTPAAAMEVVATAMAGMALHAATLNMLVASGAFSQEQADQAYANALRYLNDAATDAPESAETFAMAEALILSLADDGGIAF